MSRERGGVALAPPSVVTEHGDEGRRLSLIDLIGLAAGGAVGSGWLLGAVAADQRAGSDAVYSWLIGGVLMLAVAVVMVELGTAIPKTGGLVFLPLQSSGPMVATISAAGVWIFYAVNPASEAAAMTSGLSAWRPGLFHPGGSRLTVQGFGWAVAFMLVISAVNLLGPRLFLRFNTLLTAWKILIPLLVVVLLIFAGVDAHRRAGSHAYAGPAGHRGFSAALAAVTGGGVIYAYLGFQGPLSFAGSVRQRGRMSEAARLRWAVYGTVCGSIVLYTLLQVVFIRQHALWATDVTESPYAQFAASAALGWIVPLIRVDALLSPGGSGMVFTHALTREVAALSRAHLTHRGLQSVRRAIIRPFGRRLDVYWAILIVDFVVGVVALILVGGSWTALIAITSVLALIVYAVPSMVFAALQPKHEENFPGSQRVKQAQRILAEFDFVCIIAILYAAGWGTLWQGMAALGVGCCLLFSLPAAAKRQLPLIGQWLSRYDAKACVTGLREWRSDPAAQSAVVLLACLSFLTAATLVGSVVFGAHPVYRISGAVVVAAVADVAFRRLVSLSHRYMKVVRPILPSPVPRTVGGEKARP